ncbi:MAG: hypothetical protein ACK47B_11545 [Armatimonadota bacterium]
MLRPLLPALLATAALTALSPGPAAPTATSEPITLFQTNGAYDPRLDLKTDLVAIHAHGAAPEAVARAIESWKGAGYRVHRMFFIGSDARGRYTRGELDGRPHLDETETDAEGRVLAIGSRPYMVPTAGWLAYLKEEIRRSIDAGADGIWPEEPLMHAASGYSEAFKAAWGQAYDTPWEPPHGSPSAYFRASRLKADLYLNAVQELLQATREHARRKGRPVKFLLPVHSPISYASWNLIFPHAAASKLPLDGVIAQVWTGPARSPVTYEGSSGPQFFESSWMMYSYFATLMEKTGKPLYFLADPVEDDLSYGWPDYEKWYESVLAASLMFPQATGYEVMPWPERIYLPGRTTGGGTPAPTAYRTELSNVIAALQELPAAGRARWEGGTRGIGVVTLDTLMWQRGGPQGSSMRSLHGLVLPLLKRGVPVEIVPGERAADPGFLSRFKVLLVSYDMQKPLAPEVNEALARWARAGGSLVVLGGEDAYNGVDGFWRERGFPGPTEHLLSECGARVDLAQRSAANAQGRFQPVLRADGPHRDLKNRRFYTVDLSPHRGKSGAALVRLSDLYPQDGWGAWIGRVRLLDGSRVAAEFQAGTPEERPFVALDSGSTAAATHRFTDRDAEVVYRFEKLGPGARLELELGNQFLVSVAPAESLPTLEPARKPLPSLTVPVTYPLVRFPATGAKPLYHGSKSELPAWTSPVGKGSLLYCGLPAAFMADSADGATLLRALTRLACEEAGLKYAEGPLVTRRGPYVIAHAQGRPVRLRGRYLDLFDAELKLLENPLLPPDEPVLLKAVRSSGKLPALLHASRKTRVVERTATALRLTASGPEGTTGVVRVDPAGRQLHSAQATNPQGRRVPVEALEESGTVLVRYPLSPQELAITLRWQSRTEKEKEKENE